MKILLWGPAVVFFAFILHLVWWRIKIPQRQVKTLLKIFLAALLFWLFVFQIFQGTEIQFLLFFPTRWPEFLHVSIMVITVTLSYISFYTALEVDSPTLVMILKIEEAGPEGMDKNIFEKTLSDDLLVKPRVKDLIRDEMVFMEGDKYKINAKGRRLVYALRWHRKLMGVTGRGG